MYVTEILLIYICHHTYNWKVYGVSFNSVLKKQETNHGKFSNQVSLDCKDKSNCWESEAGRQAGWKMVVGLMDQYECKETSPPDRRIYPFHLTLSFNFPTFYD